MADTHDAEHDDQQARKQAEHTVQSATAEGQALGLGLGLGQETLPAYPSSLLGDARLSGRGNGPVRSALVQRMQQSYGNRATQRFLQRSAAPAVQREDVSDEEEEKKLEEETTVQTTRANNGALVPVQREDPPGAGGAAKTPAPSRPSSNGTGPAPASDGNPVGGTLWNYAVKMPVTEATNLIQGRPRRSQVGSAVEKLQTAENATEELRGHYVGNPQSGGVRSQLMRVGGNLRSAWQDLRPHAGDITPISDIHADLVERDAGLINEVGEIVASTPIAASPAPSTGGSQP